MPVAGLDLNPIHILSVLKYPIGWLLSLLTQAFAGVGVLAAIGAVGLAIIATTLIIQVLLFPLYGWQLKTQRRIQQEQRLVGPQIQEIRKRYKGQARKAQEEMQKVYAEHGVSPFSSMSGCLPLLVQFPVLYGLFYAIRNVTSHLPKGIDPHFLWIADVSKTVGQAVGNNFGHLFTHPFNLTLLIVPLITGAAQFIQSRMVTPPMRPDMSDTERQMSGMTRNMAYMFPIMTLVFAIIWPQGLAIYWMTRAIAMIVQQFHLMGWGSLRIPTWMPGAGRTTPLSYPKSDFSAPAARGTGHAPVASSNGRNGAARSGAVPPRSTRPGARAGRPSGPTAPGTGRVPARAQRKGKRRR
jgi:YidC/Oxa1 family membrane protein insertase